MKTFLSQASSLPLLGFLMMSYASAQNPAVSLVGANAQAWHGASVAVDGDLMVVGAPIDDTSGENSGLVRIYQTSTGNLLHTLQNPTPSANDNFGNSVAISGNRVVVGAYQDNTGAAGAGTAYVYDLSSPAPTVPILTLNKPSTPTPVTAQDRFGYSVGISGTRIVVGAYRDDTGAIDAGSAYVFDLNNPSPAVPILKLHNPAPLDGDWFGASVAISGNRVVVGAYQDDVGATVFAGRAFVYDVTSGTPTVPLHTLNNPFPGTSDNFGYVVAISGSRVVVGANLDDTGATDSGSAYVYELASGTPNLVATLNDPNPASSNWFGASVAISGLRVVVGSLNNNAGAANSGRAFVYDLLPGTPFTTLTNPTPASSDWFGTSVAASGNYILVGTPGHNATPSTEDEAGAVYVYRFPSTPTGSSATRLPNGNIQMQFNALSGLVFEIRRSTDMNSWSFLTNATAGPSGIAHTDTTPPSPRAFYRLQAP